MTAGHCPSCGQQISPPDSFCQACGTELAPAAASTGTPGQPACPACPGAPVSAEGYCESCGSKVPSARDHVELDLGLVAGVTDRGLRHHRNEDAMAMAAASTPGGPAVIGVVCDGVSTSRSPDEASLAAAQAAAGVLLAAARAGDDLAQASQRAAGAAKEAVARLAQPPGDAPAATFLSAVLTEHAITLCWLGDSRAYWLTTDPAGSKQLSRDDTLAEEMVEAGLLTGAEALTAPGAHVVTRWLGAGLSEAVPHLASFEPPGPGVLLLCSDGLWNYQPGAPELASLALPTALTSPLDAARKLVTFALEAGGADNITVVLIPYPPGPAGSRSHHETSAEETDR